MTSYDNLVVGQFPVVKARTTIGGNQTLKKGCVLGKKNVSAGAKEEAYFALSSLTAAEGTLSVTIGEQTYSIATDSESTIDGMLTALAAEVNADTTCEFGATGDTTNDRFYVKAKAVGAAQHSVSISMDKTGITLTIGSKTGVTTGTDPSNGEYYAVVAASDDGTQYPRAVLLEDVTVANGSTAEAAVAFTGEFNKEKLSFGSTDTWATHETAMRDRCMFVRDIVPTIGG